MVRSTIKASEVLQRELKKFIDDGKITIHLGVTPKEIKGNKDSGVTSVIGVDKNNKELEFPTDGVFVFIGLKPNTDFLSDSEIIRDPIGFIETDSNLQTSVQGVFAAGDVRSGATMQIASAAGEGATAALKIREYLEGKLENDKPVVLSLQ